MGRPLRVLMVEDSEDDVLLAIHALKQGGFDPVYEQVETPEEMAVALHRETWDLIVCAYTMPRFNGLAAIQLLKETGLDLPFLLLSGKIGEETAVEALKAGAHGYVMKNNLIHLAPAVERVLQEAKVRIRDRQAAQNQTLYTRLLDLLNNPSELDHLAKNILSLIRENTGIDAVAIRLKRGEDFPYYETSGFPSHFLKAEATIQLRNNEETFLLDGQGKPLLDCMCGNVLSGKTDPALPCFTAGGSFWTNSLSKFLASPMQKDFHPERMMRCQGAGYESMALIPLKSGDRTIGLFQFNHRRPNRFSPEMIQFLEGVVTSIGIAVNRLRTLEALRNSEKKYRELADFLPLAVFEADREGRIITANRATSSLFGLSPDDLERGITIQQLVPPRDLERIRENVLKLITGKGRMDAEYTLTKQDGSEFPALLFLAPILQEGRISGLRGTVIDMTEIKQVEEACRISEEKYRNICENALEGFFQNAPDGRLLSANAAFAKMCGYESPEEMLASGFNFSRHFYQEPGARTEFLKLLYQTGAAKGFECGAYRKDGSRIWVSMKIRIVKDGQGNILYHDGFIEDITRRREADEQLRKAYLELQEASDRLIESEEKYRSICENALEGFFQNAPDGRLLSANTAFARMTGYESPEEMMSGGFTFAEHYYVDPEARKELLVLLEESGAVNGFEFEAYRKDGSKIWVSTKVRAVRDKTGNFLYHEGFVEDITRRREADEQLRQAYLVLQETSDRLIEADKLAAVGTLAAGVAHEILNPVNIIATGIATLEITQDLSEPVKEAFAIFKRQVDRVIRITRDLQQFSRKSAGEMEPSDVQELIRNTLAFCEPRFKMENVTREIDYDEAMPKVMMDPNRMGQVLLNIFNNALDAMEGKDSKVLRIAAKCLPGSGTDPKRVLISISDQGGGIPPETMNRIFDPFFTTKKVGKGTGLGLSISHNIVQNHGGRIWAENNSSGGTTFFVELPVDFSRSS